LTALAGIVIFAAALIALHDGLEHYHYGDLRAAFAALPPVRILASALCTVLGYLALTGYDALALRMVGAALPLRRTAFVSFLSYAIGNSSGFGNLAGSSVRYRLYGGWGLSPIQVAQVVLICNLTFWIGFLATGAIVFLVDPVAIPTQIHLHVSTARPLGFVFAALILAYFACVALGKHRWTIRGVEIPLPTGGAFFAQLAISSLDWTLAGTALYVLLPDGVAFSWGAFLCVWLLVCGLAVVSSVPGGLGVIESLMVLFLAGPSVSSAAVLGSVLAFRAIYYLMPLALAALMFAWHEAARGRHGLRAVEKTLVAHVAPVVPDVLALLAFLVGIALLLSGATPPITQRIASLRSWVPLPVIELSHFLASLVGLGLLILAHGLRRRLDSAYHLTIALLVLGALFSVLKGWDYEEAALAGILLLALVPSRREFYRKSPLLDEPMSAAWLLSILAGIGGSVWLGIFSYKHVEYSNEMWWAFALHGDAPRFLRATVGVTAGASLFAIARLLRPADAAAVPASAEDLARAATVIAGQPRATANLALVGDKSLLFSSSGGAFLMYGVHGQSWIAMGDPVGPQDEWAELIWRFCELVERQGGRVGFYEVGRERLDLYLDAELTFFKLGEQGRVRLDAFTLEGGRHKELRRTDRHLRAEGYGFRVMPPTEVVARVAELRVISDSWLEHKSTNEKGFSLGYFDEDYVTRTSCAVVERNGVICAFANLWTAGRHELSIDLMRYGSDAPHAVMDYLFVELILWGREQGFAWFDLGMAPLSGLEHHAPGSLWSKVGHLVFRFGEHFYNFEGLRRYKAKFDPEWEPAYLACARGLVVAELLADVAALVSGGLKGVVTK
jgi:phosphatidylglycerol lysyltransferase